MNGFVTSYLVDKNRSFAQVLEERDGSGGLIVSYVYGDDLISQNRSGTASYYHYDGLGSTRVLTDGNETPTDSYTYEAFGNTLGATGSTVNNYLFTGEQLDLNTGFYYLRSRYLNPQVGRFLTQDTWPGLQFDPPTLHKYVYVLNNPVNFVDPSGAAPLAQTLAITGLQFAVNTILSISVQTFAKVLAITGALVVSTIVVVKITEAIARAIVQTASDAAVAASILNQAAAIFRFHFAQFVRSKEFTAKPGARHFVELSLFSGRDFTKERTVAKTKIGPVNFKLIAGGKGGRIVQFVYKIGPNAKMNGGRGFLFRLDWLDKRPLEKGKPAIINVHYHLHYDKINFNHKEL